MQRMRFADVRGLRILLRALRAQPVRGLRVPVPHVRRPPVLGLPGILRAVRRTLLPLLLRTARLREHAGPLLPGPVRGTARPRAVHLRTGNRSGRQPRHRHAQEPQAHRRLVPGRQPPPRRLPRIPERTHDHEPTHGNPPTRRTHRHRHRQHAVGRAHAHQPHRPADPGPLVLGAGSARRNPMRGAEHAPHDRHPLVRAHPRRLLRQGHRHQRHAPPHHRIPHVRPVAPRHRRKTRRRRPLHARHVAVLPEVPRPQAQDPRHPSHEPRRRHTGHQRHERHDGGRRRI